MLNFPKKYYQTYGFSVILVTITLLGLNFTSLIRLPDDAIFEIFLNIIFWSIFVTIIILGFPQIKKGVIFKILGLIAIILITIEFDRYMKMPDNPLTLFLMAIFWIGIVYLISPQFVIKYRWYILGIFGGGILFFTVTRLVTPDFKTFETQYKNTALDLISYPLPIFVMLWIYEQWAWLKKLKTDKAHAELAMLKAQVNPHFFFNTLNNLYALTVKQSEQAPEVVLKLSDMMRYTIYEGQKDSVLLKEEVEYLTNYIELHKIRYHKTVNIQFEHDFDPSDEISPLLFIILLENAFKHGVESLADAAYIRMYLKSNQEEISFSIENNFDPSEQNDRKGVGLENLKRRLDLIYPKKHELQVVQENDIFKVELKLIK